jgi:hypothetical protein
MQEEAAGQSVENRALPLIGGRRFWVFSGEARPGEQEADEAFNAAFAELDARYRADRSGPIGVCLPVSDPELMRRRPEAVWAETELLYAGTQQEAASLADRNAVSTQMRIRYFYDATVGPGLDNSPTIAQSEAVDYSLPPGYRMVPLAETEAAGPEDVMELWRREGAVEDPQERERRVSEVQVVGLDPNDQIAAVSTAFVEPDPQLGMDVWNLRGFVATEHRMGNLATQILWATRDHLRRQFESSPDANPGAVIVVVQNQLLMTYFNRAFWVYSDFTYIGDVAGGAHLRVHYFPGAQAPIPSEGQG